MNNSLKLTLKYSGQDVNEGSMLVEDMIPALQGFSSAYGKIATAINLQQDHKIRIVGVEKGSCNIVLDVVNKVKEDPHAVELVGGGGIGTVVWIVKGIIKIIKATKVAKNRSVQTKASNGSVVLYVPGDNNNVVVEMPPQIYDLYKNKNLSSDLNKMASPLEEDKIDSTKIIMECGDAKEEEEISLDDKIYFDTEIPEVAQTMETWIEGRFNSLYKSTNKGKFILKDGSHVLYKISIEKPENLYAEFAYNGSVSIRCKALLDENLKPILLEVFEVKRLQVELFPEKSIKTRKD